MTIKRFTQLFLFFCVLISYYIFIAFGYENIAYPMYSYLGFRLVDWSVGNVVSGLLFTLILSILLPKKPHYPSDFVAWIFFLMVFIPSCSIPFLTGVSNDYIFFLISSGIIILMIGNLSKLPVYQFSNYTIKKHTLFLGLFSISTVFYAIIFKTYGIYFSINLDSFSDVYDLRAEYKENSNKLAVYALNWQAKILNPFILLLGLTLKKYHYFIIGVVGQILLFFITGLKSIPFSILLVIGLYILIKKKEVASFKLGISLFFLVLSSIILYYSFNITFFFEIIVRRTIMIPGLLSGYYFEFFTENPKALLSHSFLSGVFENIYTTKPSETIGAFYFEKPGANANANFLADAYANFGNIGIILFGLILSFTFWLYNSLAISRGNQNWHIILLALSGYYLNDSALFTTFLTHGLLLVFIITYLSPANLSDINKTNLKKL
ncbi:O-antigen polymerase [Bacillus cereus]|uniref:O-antigen polymerase n=1 Tax=Bacillus cereus TaxID=1396 RepID=UPI00032DC2EC|nr:O-antigen polymerase [Bacillus cereus]EOQ02682.1 hypothetical protein IIY_01817 [Bacillus cereus VD140]MDF9536113.1 O-antigen ligase [Bacillus cereus]